MYFLEANDFLAFKRIECSEQKICWEIIFVEKRNELCDPGLQVTCLSFIQCSKSEETHLESKFHHDIAAHTDTDEEAGVKEEEVWAYSGIIIIFVQRHVMHNNQQKCNSRMSLRFFLKIMFLWIGCTHEVQYNITIINDNGDKKL